MPRENLIQSVVALRGSFQFDHSENISLKESKIANITIRYILAPYKHDHSVIPWHRPFLKSVVRFAINE